MQKFLVIQTAFVGDVVLATAIAEKLHVHYPNALIDFLVRKGNDSLFAGHPYLNKVWVWDKKKSKISNLIKLAVQLRREKYSHVINPHRFASSGLLSFWSAAAYRSCFDKNPLSNLATYTVAHQLSEPYTHQFVHEVERNQQLIAPLTGGKAEAPRLYPTQQDYDSVKEYKTKAYVCIAPSSVWATKQYPAAKWIELIDNLPSAYNVYLLGGPGKEALIAEAIKEKVGRSNCINLSGKLSFLQSAVLMKDAVMNYVNDSAPLHFCSAVDAPVTAVFCSTVPAFGFTPIASKAKVIEVEQRLSCRPCGLHGKASCPLGHFHCAEKIKTEQLLWWI